MKGWSQMTWRRTSPWCPHPLTPAAWSWPSGRSGSVLLLPRTCVLPLRPSPGTAILWFVQRRHKYVNTWWMASSCFSYDALFISHACRGKKRPCSNRQHRRLHGHLRVYWCKPSWSPDNTTLYCVLWADKSWLLFSIGDGVHKYNITCWIDFFFFKQNPFFALGSGCQLLRAFLLMHTCQPQTDQTARFILGFDFITTHPSTPCTCLQFKLKQK